MARILVLYGTTEGQTAKIAKAIASTLRGLGVDTDIVEAAAIELSPRPYDGVIVAASVHVGSYQKAVQRWVRAHAADLASRPTAFVSVSLGVLQKDEKTRAEVAAIVRRFLDAAGWTPSMTRHVAGALLYRRYNFVIRWIMKRKAAAAGGDTDTSRDYEYTDWNDVRAFAGEFARKVSAAA